MSGRRWRSLLKGVISPLPAGIAMNAWRVFAMTDSNSGNGTPALPLSNVLTHLCNMASKNTRLS